MKNQTVDAAVKTFRDIKMPKKYDLPYKYVLYLILNFK